MENSSPDHERHVFETPTTPSLKMVGNCYKPAAPEPEGLTIFLAHCIGAHKEQWEPIIHSLFVLQKDKPTKNRIREIWAFDWQSHGDSAVLNQEVLKKLSRSICEPLFLSYRASYMIAFDWTHALTAFVQSPQMIGHRIVPIGHSAGAAAVLLTTRDIHRYPAIILIEPTIVAKDVFISRVDDRMAQMDFVVATTSNRRDSWTSRSQAYKYFVKRIPWGLWDPRIVRLLTDYGLEDLPSGTVGLKCQKTHEASSYPDIEPHFEGARQLAKACLKMPIHLIWGTRKELVPEFIQDSLAEGSGVASVAQIQDAGHFVVQEKPGELAKALSDILNTIRVDKFADKSKL
ncbi:Alpha/beta hydrolase fold-1 [Crepidotus variabilis]|uniref:Alpha/beta hydrolase fold-1 n=1 Tax=Crepidotus variabilis TaxID=179855 RepID=A0A9P6JJA1_9AGAR|nr:Alpha/beta hydrolase fold-1 [Crepidotus variabilis]